MKKQSTEQEEDSHLNPLAPATAYRKSDEPFAPFHPFTPPQKSNKCIVYVLLLVVFLSIAFLIFGLVVLRINTPTARISTVAIENLRYESSPTSATLNTTMVAEVLVRNANFGRFRFRDGNATLMYGNATIGSTVVSGGRIGRRERRSMNMAFVVTWAEYVSSSSSGNYANFSRDMNSGLMMMNSYVELRGEVRVIRIVNRHRTAVVNCSMALNFTAPSVQVLSCQ